MTGENIDELVREFYNVNQKVKLDEFSSVFEFLKVLRYKNRKEKKFE
jgi:hypothetical protein